MVLGLIEFLLGKKKKKASTPPVSSASTTPVAPIGASPQPVGPQAPAPAATPPASANDVSHIAARPPTPPPGKRPIGEILNKIQQDLKESNSKLVDLIGEVKELQNNVINLTHRVDLLEENKKIVEERFNEIDSSMNKFLSLYELINNQYSPFVANETPKDEKKKILVTTDGEAHEESTSPSTSVKVEKPKFDVFENSSNDSEDDPLIELDTLNIQEAAGNAVPLVSFKNDTNSLVIILSWLEYMINKVGIEGTRNTLRYYTEVLKWITPEVYFELDKYLKGMKDKSDLKGDETLGVKDHIVSLYFISKLNDKPLDEKLTKAVLKIIRK